MNANDTSDDNGRITQEEAQSQFDNPWSAIARLHNENNELKSKVDEKDEQIAELEVIHAQYGILRDIIVPLTELDGETADDLVNQQLEYEQVGDGR